MSELCAVKMLPELSAVPMLCSMASNSDREELLELVPLVELVLDAEELVEVEELLVEVVLELVVELVLDESLRPSSEESAL